MMHTIVITLVAAAALAGCNKENHTIVAGPDGDKQCRANAPVVLPPSIAASKTYRCGDNSVVFVDWLSDNKSANVRTDATGSPTQVVAAEPGKPLTGSGFSLTGTADRIVGHARASGTRLADLQRLSAGLTLPLRPSINAGCRGNSRNESHQARLYRRRAERLGRAPASSAGLRAAARRARCRRWPRSALMAEAHMRRFALPGLTLGLTHARRLRHECSTSASPIATRGFRSRHETLFQIGSISKVMAAALLHQFAAEGRFALTDRVSALLPGIPLPPGNAITVQHLLDHVAGLPADAPTFPDGGLWTAYAPGRALALFEHRLRHPRQARGEARRQAARPPARRADLHSARHAPDARGDHRRRPAALRSGL